MKVLSLDQSSKISGFAFFDDENLLKYDIIDTSKCGNLIERITMLTKWFDYFFSKHQVDLVVLEDVTFQNEAKYKKTEEYKQSHVDEDTGDNLITFQSLSKVLGVLEFYLHTHGIKYKVVKPSQWRSMCGIKGIQREAAKQAAINFVKNKWDIDAKEDACEAICIGYGQVHQKPKVAWGNMFSE